MKEFSCTSYYTKYSCTGTYERAMASGACFGEIFGTNIRKLSDVTYTIEINTIVHRGRNNFCPFTLPELRSHVRQLTQIIPLEWAVNVQRTAKEALYIVTLHLKDQPKMFHKYVLNWVRLAYEFPYNMLLRDAHFLKKDPKFRFESYSNLFVVCAACSELGGWGHSCTGTDVVYLLTKKELANKIATESALNNIYKCVSYRSKINKALEKLPKQIADFGRYDLEYWSADFFEGARKPLYVKLYNKLKK